MHPIALIATGRISSDSGAQFVRRMSAGSNANATAINSHLVEKFKEIDVDGSDCLDMDELG
jgi:hypothetical protein